VVGALRQRDGSRSVISDGNDSYWAAELGLSHQLCVAHACKHVAKRADSILEQAEKEWNEEDEKLEKLAEDLEVLKGLFEELSEEGAHEIGWLHRGYMWSAPPRRKGRETKKASVAYRMRMPILGLWNKWRKMRLHLARPNWVSMAPTTQPSEASARARCAARRCAATRAWTA